MQTIQLQIEDNKLDTVLTLIENLKDGIVKNITIQSDGLDEETKAYMETEQFQKDKAYFHKCLDDIENGKEELVSFDEGFNELDNYIDKIAHENTKAS